MGCGGSKAVETDPGSEKIRFQTNHPMKIHRDMLTQLTFGGLFVQYDALLKDDFSKKSSSFPFFDFEVEGKIFESQVKFFVKTMNDEKLITQMLDHNKDKSIVTLRGQIKKICPEAEVGFELIDVPTAKRKLYIMVIIPLTSCGGYKPQIANCLAEKKFLSMDKLCLNDMSLLAFPQLVDILTALKTNIPIRTLSMSFNAVEDFTLMFTMSNLAVNVGITKLKLHDFGLCKNNIGLLNYLLINKAVNPTSKKIINVNLSWNNIESLEAIKDPLASMQLESLNISNNTLTDFSALGEIISSTIETLRKLKLGKCQLKAEEQFKSIFPSKVLSYKNIPLQVLDISFNYVNFTTLSTMITVMKQLNKLILQRPNVDESDSNVLNAIKHFGKTYMSLPNVKTLHINFRFDEALQHFAKGLTEAKSIDFSNVDKCFKLFKSNINAEACTYLLPVLSYMRTVDLSFCGIGSFETLCNALTLDQSNVQELSLANCSIKEEEYKKLCQFIAKSKTISSLSLENNLITGGIVGLFCQAINNNRGIKKLVLNFCFMNESGENSIQPFTAFCENAALPSLDELHIERCEFPSSSLGSDLATFLERNTAIRVLKIGASDEMFKHALNSKLLSGLSCNQIIEAISITNIRLTLDALNQFLSIIGNKNKNLKNISLNNVFQTTMHQNEQIAFFENLINLSQLQNLSIVTTSMTNFMTTETIVAAVKKLLSTNQSLENIIIALHDNKNLSPECLNVLLSGIKGNSKLAMFKLLIGEDSKHFLARNPTCFLPVEYSKVIETYYQVICTCANLKDFSLFFVKYEDFSEIKFGDIVPKIAGIMKDEFSINK